MSESSIRVVFDYVDPGSYLVHETLRAGSAGGAFPREILWTPLELRPPALPPLDPADPAWSGMIEALAAKAEESGIPFRIPEILPRSRKAHELGFMAREKGCFAPVHTALFHAHFRDGRDIGRVDVLVELGGEAGMDPTEVRTVLGVDRHLPRVIEERDEALALGVRGVPTLLAGDRRLEGFHGTASLASFFASLPGRPASDENPNT